MAKAYDRVESEFLSAVLKGFRFQSKIHDLIMSSVQGARFSILINGNLEGKSFQLVESNKDAPSLHTYSSCALKYYHA